MRVALSPDLLVALTGKSRAQLKSILTGQPSRVLERPESLCAWLEQQQLLTPYQAQHAAAGRGDGLIVGQYVVLREVGHGNMGMVYLARHRLMSRQAALKVFTPDDPQSENLQRFLREIQATAQLDHPHLIKAYEAGEHQGSYFLAMEYVEGENLQQKVEREGPLPWERALTLLAHAGEGLNYAHQLGMVHRDIKPGNIMLSTDGRVLVLDLGLVRILKDFSGMFSSVDGTVRGTAAYMSPEQALNIRNADYRSDIYSLGSTLYFVLTGQPMFPEKGVMQQLLAHQHKPPPSLLQQRPDLPADLEPFYQRMVAKSPEARYASMQEVIQCFQCLIHRQPLPDTARESAISEVRHASGVTASDPPSPAAWRRLLPFWRE